ncbi:type IV pilin N-terminal domain-containing protein [Salinirubellus salinus]|uniref:Type IV pilin N-terminal domain-containing protein n=1 Tax=Salinirubellus salinus TaxID=1364945 RepID=A0A9E7QZZ9_9EURY|nr:type IV pilin N-terminal domain-containing protein [Salinirubellus salinus]UWM53141.1 type IV pilin N-terminal domain-containing protein [Salinirubellus salinus]
MRGSRGQSESLGVLFAVGITLVLSATVFLNFGSLGGSLTDTPPGARIDVEASGSTVTLTHESGEVIDTEELTLVFGQGEETNRVPLSSVTSGMFGAGDSLTVNHGFGDGDLSIRLIHEPTNGVIVNAERVIEDAFGVSLSVSESGGTYTFDPTVTGGTKGAPTVALSDATVDGFAGSQDKTGSVAFTDGGDGIRLDGNRWQDRAYDYYVTGDTVVAFEFRSDAAEGEIQGLSLEKDNSVSPARSLRAWGSQNWGTAVQDVNGQSYSPGDGWRTYRVQASQLGAFSAGSSDRIDRIVFVNDDDADANADTQIRNVRLYEDGEDYQYRWEVDDGSDFTLVSNEPTFSSPSLDNGDVVRLTVLDAAGQTTTATYTVS